MDSNDSVTSVMHLNATTEMFIINTTLHPLAKNITSPSTNPNTVAFSSAINIFGFIACGWVLIANSVIVLCFVLNRRKPWTSYAKQIFSLALNDMLLGVACNVLLIGPYTGALLNYYICAFSLFFFFTAQCASLYNVFGICLYRFLTVMKEPLNTIPVSLKLVVVMIILSWSSSMSLCAISFISWGNHQSVIHVCQIDEIYVNNRRKAIAYLAITYIVPLLLTNVLYIVTCVKLLTIWKKVFPRQSLNANVTAISLETSNQNNNQSYRSNIKIQRTALGTIGLILFLFNIFTLPLIYAMLKEQSGAGLSRDIRATMSIVFALNSAVNPFVYAMRTKVLRDALNDLRRDIFIIFGMN